MQIRDLKSRNGTFVNGLPIGIRTLAGGDVIQIGGSTFLFGTEGGAGSIEAVSVRMKQDIDTETVVDLRKMDAAYLAPDWLPETGAQARSLKALLDISAAIRTADGWKALAVAILRSVLDALDARQGVILLVDAGSVRAEEAASWDRDRGGSAEVAVGENTVDRCLKENSALFSRGPTGRLAAVPLASRGKTVAVLYIIGAPTWDRDREEFVKAAAAIAGPSIDGACQLEQLERENRRLTEETQARYDMIGESQAMQDVYRFISRTAHAQATVLIHGESGTGKELIARAIHNSSDRARGPFIAVNCAALTETLLESELFGHEAGSFTGARPRRGCIELADGGTLFLDEVGEMSSAMQSKLLRALQEYEFRRVGGERTIRVNTRVLAATNRNLKEAAEQGTFRQDLYFRLNVLSLTVPPLRERSEDIQLLATHFARRFAEENKRKLAGIDSEARECLAAYSWPGNVRELKNTIERAIVMGDSEYLVRDDLPEEVLEAAATGRPATGSYHDEVVRLKKELILAAVKRTGGNYKEAATQLGLHPNFLHRLIRQFQLKETIRKAVGQ